MILLENSTFVRYLRKIDKARSRFEQYLYDIYSDSRTNRMVKDASGKIAESFRQSFFFRLSQINAISMQEIHILHESRAIGHLACLYNILKKKVIFVFTLSKSRIVVGNLKEGLSFSPVFFTSILMLSAASTNIVFSLLSKIEITLFGWIIRVLILLTAAAGLTARVGWIPLKKNSMFLRLISKRCAGSAGK